MTEEAQTPEFLLSGDDVAESFMSLVASTDPLFLRAIFANTALLFLANEKGNAEEMSNEELQEALVRVSNDAFDLLVKELEAIRNDKINFATSVGTLL